MRKIKNIRQLRAEQQKLQEKQIRLEEKMEHQWLVIKENNKVLVNAVTWGYAVLSGRWWAKVAKRWFEIFK